MHSGNNNSNSNNVNNAEKDVLNNFLNFENNTHNVAITSGVANAIYLLQTTYIGEGLFDTSLEAGYQANFKMLFGTDYSPQNAITAIQEIKAKSAVIKIFTEKLSSSLPESRIEQSINFLLQKMYEPVEELDDMDFYIPNKENPSEIQHIKTRFPLWKVVVLLCRALQDYEKFELTNTHNEMVDEEKIEFNHNNNNNNNSNNNFMRDENESDSASSDNDFASSGSDINDEDRRKMQMEKDFTDRLLTLFNTLNRIRKGICHHGIRNALIYDNLDGCYRGVNILIDPSIPAIGFLKENIPHIFWSMYQRIGDKKELGQALYTWMRDSNPQRILQLVDPNKTIRAGLKAQIIKNGNNPDTLRCYYNKKNLSFNELIDVLETQLMYPVDTSKKYLYSLCDIINKNGDKAATARDLAILKIQKWLQNEMPLETENQIVCDFYAVDRAYLTLTDKKDFLTLTGTKTKKQIAGLIDICQAYFTDFSLEPNIINLQEIHNFNVDLSALERNAFVSEIENFLILFNNNDTCRQAYRYLLQADFRKRTTLTDAQILNLEKTQVVTEDKQTYLAQDPNDQNFYFDRGKISFLAYKPYVFMLYVLHAILEKKWTPLFLSKFNELLTMLENYQDDLPRVDRQIMRLSDNSLRTDISDNQKFLQLIDTDLMKQLKYLAAKASHNLITNEMDDINNNNNQVDFNLPRPDNMILLPEQIETPQEFVNCLDYMNHEQRESEYLKNKNLINQKYYLALADCKNSDEATEILTRWLPPLPINIFKSIVNSLGKKSNIKFFDLSRIIDSRNIFTTNQIDIIIQAFSRKIPSIITNAEQLYSLINNVSFSVYKSIIQSFNEDTLYQYINQLGLLSFCNNFSGTYYLNKRNKMRHFLFALPQNLFLRFDLDVTHPMYKNVPSELLKLTLIQKNSFANETVIDVKKLNAMMKPFTTKSLQKDFLTPDRLDKIKNLFSECKTETNFIKLFNDLTTGFKPPSLRVFIELIGLNANQIEILLFKGKCYDIITAKCKLLPGIFSKLSLSATLQFYLVMSYSTKMTYKLHDAITKLISINYPQIFTIYSLTAYRQITVVNGDSVFNFLNSLDKPTIQQLIPDHKFAIELLQSLLSPLKGQPQKVEEIVTLLRMAGVFEPIMGRMDLFYVLEETIFKHEANRNFEEQRFGKIFKLLKPELIKDISHIRFRITNAPYADTRFLQPIFENLDCDEMKNLLGTNTWNSDKIKLDMEKVISDSSIPENAKGNIKANYAAFFSLTSNNEATTSVNGKRTAADNNDNNKRVKLTSEDDTTQNNNIGVLFPNVALSGNINNIGLSDNRFQFFNNNHIENNNINNNNNNIDVFNNNNFNGFNNSNNNNLNVFTNNNFNSFTNNNTNNNNNTFDVFPNDDANASEDFDLARYFDQLPKPGY